MTVRTYQLYLIDDEVASQYFGKERMLVELFKQYDEASGELKNILSKQIDFITKSIQTFKLHHFINQNLQKNKSFYARNSKYYIEIGKRSYADLEIHQNCLIVRADGKYDAETAFFEVLRKAETSFIALDLENSYCGWLKPIKERKFI